MPKGTAENKISVKEAADLLGVSQQFIRIGLQTGRIPIGTAVKMSTRWCYYINEKQLADYIGTAIPNQEKGYKHEKRRNH